MYNISRENVEFNIEQGSPKKIYFQSPYASGNQIIDRAKALQYGDDSNKALVFIHGFGEMKIFELLKYYPKYFAENSYTVLMPVLPFLMERKPEKYRKKDLFLSGFAEDIEKRFYQSVNDIRTFIDYLEEEGYEEVNIMGFSFGGIISTIAMALDQRIARAVLVVTGGDMEHITWESLATEELRNRYRKEDYCDSEKCHELHQNFDQAAAEFQKLEDLKKFPACFRYDPSFFAHRINSEKVLMFNALFDKLIPRESADDLWQRLGEPKRYNLIAGHYTTHLLYKKFICRRADAFFEESLN
jgi:esterase/lipase